MRSLFGTRLSGPVPQRVAGLCRPVRAVGHGHAAAMPCTVRRGLAGPTNHLALFRRPRPLDGAPALSGRAISPGRHAVGITMDVTMDYAVAKWRHPGLWPMAVPMATVLARPMSAPWPLCWPGPHGCPHGHCFGLGPRSRVILDVVLPHVGLCFL